MRGIFLNGEHLLKGIHASDRRRRDGNLKKRPGADDLPREMGECSAPGAFISTTSIPTTWRTLWGWSWGIPTEHVSFDWVARECKACCHAAAAHRADSPNSSSRSPWSIANEVDPRRPDPAASKAAALLDPRSAWGRRSTIHDPGRLLRNPGWQGDLGALRPAMPSSALLIPSATTGILAGTPGDSNFGAMLIRHAPSALLMAVSEIRRGRGAQPTPMTPGGPINRTADPPGGISSWYHSAVALRARPISGRRSSGTCSPFKRLAPRGDLRISMRRAGSRSADAQGRIYFYRRLSSPPTLHHRPCYRDRAYGVVDAKAYSNAAQARRG